MVNAIGGAELGEIDVLGRGEKFLKGRLKLGDRQHFKNATAIVIDEDDREMTLEFLSQ